MKTNKKPVIAIGWDVRGWRGGDQALAVLAFAADRATPDWLGVSEGFRFEPGKPLGMQALLQHLPDAGLHAGAPGEATVVLGIDAPLAFPRALVSLLTGTIPHACEPPAREIDNAFAYRDCERWVLERHGKKPLSAAFDKLGNNATLALCMARALAADGFRLVPQQGAAASRALIEVYPAIAKRGRKKSDRAIAALERHIPAALVPGTDPYDAAICAILAAVFAGRGPQLGLPDLVGPEPGYDPAEGWIYGLPAAYVRSHAG